MSKSAWPSGQGEMAGRICTYDWAATPLGPISSWPQCLKSAVELMLATGLPTSIRWGHQATFLYNDAKARILGKLHHRMLGRPICEAPPGSWPGREPIASRVMSGESVISGEQRHVIQEEDGEREIWVQHLTSPIRDETGTVAGCWTILIDVTTRIKAEMQRKDAEEALRASEARQAFLLELSDTLHPIADPFAVMAAATRMTVEHFGAGRCCYAEFCDDGVVHRGFWIRDGVRMPERFAFVKLAKVAEGYRTGQAVATDDVETDPLLTEQERDTLRAAGMAAFVCVSVRKEMVFGVQSTTPRAWTVAEVGLIREAGERTLLAVRRARAETALRDSEERFRQFAEATTDVIWIRDAKTLRLEYWSPAFVRGFGDKWDPALGGDNMKSWVDIVVPEDRERALAAISAVQSGERVIFEYRINRPRDGEVRWMRSNLFPLLDGAGRVQRIGSICHDTTEEKATAERMGIMVAELQHRTRNLMAVVQSIVTHTLAASEDLGSFQTRINERLKVLSRVHHLLSRSGEEPITIGALIQFELDAIGSDIPPGRIAISGPEVRLRNSTIQMMAIALHELAIDARQHGALSTGHGQLQIAWDVDHNNGGRCLRLTWIEERPVCVAVRRERRGYSRELIERALPYSLNAETRYELDESWLRCTISLPLSKEVPKERGA